MLPFYCYHCHDHCYFRLSIILPLLLQAMLQALPSLFFCLALDFYVFREFKAEVSISVLSDFVCSIGTKFISNYLRFMLSTYRL